MRSLLRAVITYITSQIMAMAICTNSIPLSTNKAEWEYLESMNIDDAIDELDDYLDTLDSPLDCVDNDDMLRLQEFDNYTSLLEDDIKTITMSDNEQYDESVGSEGFDPFESTCTRFATQGNAKPREPNKVSVQPDTKLPSLPKNKPAHSCLACAHLTSCRCAVTASIPTNNSAPSIHNQVILPAPTQHFLPQVYCFPHTIICIPQIYALPCTIIVASNPDEGIPKKRTRGKDRKKRRRRCGLCKKKVDRYPYINPYECGGVGGGRKQCDYFDVKEVRRCLRCEVGGGGNQYSCAATRGKTDDCEYFDNDGNCNR